MGVKIQLIEDPVTGEKRVPERVMEILMGLAEHKKICGDCAKIGSVDTVVSCHIGLAFLEELARQPEVSEA